ncbi:hypothetical protein Tco_1190199, partial [Tanacetum coccineum]
LATSSMLPEIPEYAVFGKTTEPSMDSVSPITLFQIPVKYGYGSIVIT